MDKLKAAIEVCDKHRDLSAISSPIEISIYNAFTRAKVSLESDLALVEDALGVHK